MLRRVGLLTGTEFATIRRHLEDICAEIEAGKFGWREDLEDVHMNIEAELIRRAPCGAKLHTGRSRNDQVATDARLWMRDTLDAQGEALRGLQRAMVAWAARDGEVPLPGYTHLQRAQPVLFGHHLLAYVEMVERDLGRFQDARRRVNVCPLGSGAIAGSTLPLDREWVAQELGFVDERGRPCVTGNSMDAVSDRDFFVEYLAAAALLAVHLSRLAEDLILWSSAEFGFVRIGDAFTTGSSLMPQKRNPDVAELTRGKAGRVVGNLVALLVTLKGLPMTYNRDLQEDKERVFDTADTLDTTLAVLTAMLAEVRVRPEACAAAVADPLLLATDVADALVLAGIPFRQAHHLVGAAVGLAEKLGVAFDAVPEKELKAIHARLPEAMRVVRRGAVQQLTARRMTGAPHPKSVRAEIEKWESNLKLWERHLKLAPLQKPNRPAKKGR
jgi:argininosuccinate lyase